MPRFPRPVRAAALVVAAAAVMAGCASTAPQNPMTFFVSSSGSGNGADFGGLAGADKQCQTLASAVGAGGRTWRAYLSTNAAGPGGAANARDRIGTGPWQNAKGVRIAGSVDELHAANNLTKQTALTEKGEIVKGRGDTPNEHDILTGSRDDGTAFAPQTDTTCKAWTSSSDGSAIVGHHDRSGPLAENWARSWNFSHQSAGCSQEALVRTGGAGRFYCFAASR